MSALSSSVEMRHAAQNEIRRQLPAPASRPRLRYVPVETVEIEDCRQKPSGSCDYASCPRCRKTFAGGAIVSEPPVYRPEYGQHVTYRRMFCDGCRHIVGWLQACNARGDRLGLPVTAPSTNNTRKAVEHFLAAFPHAAGVSQS